MMNLILSTKNPFQFNIGLNQYFDMPRLHIGILTKTKIDCDKMPFIPDGYEIARHHKMGLLDLTKERIEYFITRKQNETILFGSEIQKDLSRHRPLNANVLDHLTQYQGLIPEWINDESVYFWGTTYYKKDDSKKTLYVRYIYKFGSRWISDIAPVENDIAEHHVAAILVGKK